MGALLRQCALAGAVFVGLAAAAERVAPGSVLPFFNLSYAVAVVAALLVVAPPPERPTNRWRVLFLLPIALLAIAFLSLVTAELGAWGTAAAASLVLLVLAGMVVLTYPPEHYE
jgi:drug/metabolite transporter (DMT)-like permease